MADDVFELLLDGDFAGALSVKMNPNHDRLGRFASGSGSGGGSGGGGGMMAPDKDSGSGVASGGGDSGLSDEQVYDRLLGLGVHEDYIDEMTPSQRRSRLNAGHREPIGDTESPVRSKPKPKQKPATSDQEHGKPATRKPNSQMAAGVSDKTILQWAESNLGSRSGRDYTPNELRFIYAQRVLGER